MIKHDRVLDYGVWVPPEVGKWMREYDFSRETKLVAEYRSYNGARGVVVLRERDMRGGRTVDGWLIRNSVRPASYSYIPVGCITNGQVYGTEDNVLAEAIREAREYLGKRWFLCRCELPAKATP